MFVSCGITPSFPLIFDVAFVRLTLTCRALYQGEKVVLPFLAKQGELARRLLDARRQQGGWKTGEIPTFRDGTPEGMGGESGVASYPSRAMTAAQT